MAERAAYLVDAVLPHVSVRQWVLTLPAAQVSVAAGQTTPTNPNQQAMPWFTRPQGMPGMPWFFRPPPAARPSQCWIAYCYPAQFWNTDQ
jgi:hypothetical protein